jgi:two-component system phosphate regulon sensor histidine kinase PhoR
MPIDYRRLVDGLGAVARMTDEGMAGLAAIDVLVHTLREAVGAAGATFTEYRDGGVRVVAAAGEMAWSLGQPSAPEFLAPDRLRHPFAGRVEELPWRVAEPLLGRGVLAIAVHPVLMAKAPVGAVQLYFGGVDRNEWDQAAPALSAVAAAAARIYADPEASPTGLVAEDDDRTLFLAVAGHELRTPVTVVKGYARMLADRWESLDEANRRDGVRVLAQRADELARLVDRMLGASVGDSATGLLVRTVPFDPLEALLRAARDLPSDLRRSLRLELPDSLPFASGDPSMLDAIIAELVTNAVRCTPTPPASTTTGLIYTGAEPTATVEIQAGADAHTVFIRVCDRGVGIDPTHVERAFERFWRENRDGEARAGVGLGLYLVRRLVERQDGWVSLRPRDGGGTVAEVRLPRADGPLRRPRRAEA